MFSVAMTGDGTEQDDAEYWQQDEYRKKTSRNEIKKRNLPENFADRDPIDIEVVQNMGNGAGSGVVAGRVFHQGDLICNYRGIHELVVGDPTGIDVTYKFLYHHNNELHHVDAADPTSGIGRFINDMDAFTNSNAVAKRMPAQLGASDASIITIHATKRIRTGKSLQINPVLWL
jgi:hypothetical protein